MIECTNCLFNDQNYPSIQVDENGLCDICDSNLGKIRLIQEQKNSYFLEKQLSTIKQSKRGKYDCLIGLSGGADSSYLVHLAKEWGLTPLLLHVDGGWNTETSVINIRRIVEESGFDFITEVLPWEDLKEVQRAFVKANVLDIDLPFDNAMLYYNYTTARKHGIKFILNGYSTETEGIMPSHYTHYKLDKKNILDIHAKFGERPLYKLKFIGTFDYWFFHKVKKIRFLQPLDWIEYNKTSAKKILREKYNWLPYGDKHFENAFTRFYQGYILPKKFNIDKRISHLSMLICSGQISKKDAMNMFNENRYILNQELISSDRAFFLKKLNLSASEFDLYLKSKGISHREFKSDLDVYDRYKPIYHALRSLFKFNFFE